MTELEKQELIKLGATPDEIKELEKEELIKLGATPDEIKELLNEQEGNVPTAPPSPVLSALLPRTNRKLDRNAGILSTANAIKSDVLSLPGRTIASIPEAIPEGLQTAGTGVLNFFRKDENDQPYGDGFFKTLGKGMQKEEGTTFFGDIFRNPSTAAAILATIPSKGKSIRTSGTGILSRAKTAAINNAPTVLSSAAAAALENQADKYNKEKYIEGGDDKTWSNKELAQDATFGVLGGTGGVALGNVIGAAGRAVIKKLTPRLIKSSVNNFFTDAKITGKDIANGFKKDVLIENKLYGSPEEVLERTNSIIKENADAVKQAINPTISPINQTGIAGSRNVPKIIEEPTVDVINVLSKISKSDKLTKGFTKEQTAALDDVLQRVSEVDVNGQIKLSDIPKVKHIITELRNDFTKPPASEADKILGLAYKELDNEFINVAKNTLGKNTLGDENAQIIIDANKKMSELIPIRKIVQNKINQGIEEKIPGLLGSIGKKTLSTGNVGAELLTTFGVVGLPPGAITTLNTARGVASHYTPSLARQAERNALMKNIVDQSKPPPAFIRKVMRGEELTKADAGDILRYKDAVDAIRSGKKLDKRIGTFGSISAIDSNAVSTDIKDRIKTGVKKYVKEYGDRFRKENFPTGATRSF